MSYIELDFGDDGNWNIMSVDIDKDVLQKVFKDLQETADLGPEVVLKRDTAKAFTYCTIKSHALLHLYEMPCECPSVLYEMCEIRKSQYMAEGKFDGAAEWASRSDVCKAKLKEQGIEIHSWRSEEDQPPTTNWVT